MTEIESPVGAVVSHVQTDAFCDHCGYNLNTQPVMKDERLGILVSRCPECGRYIAAGQTTAAGRVWLNRVVTSLLAAWTLCILLAFALFTLFFGVLAFGHAADATEVRSINTFTGNSIRMPGPFNPYNYQRVVREFTPDQADEARSYHTEQIIVTSITIALALLLGMLSASFFWHVRGWRRFLPMASPLLACGLCIFVWYRDPMDRLVVNFGIGQISFYLALDLLGIWAGVHFGRSVARGVVSLVLPPKVRQHLAFLWTTDGRVPPPVA
jgi:hypothetical protein